MGLFDYLRVEMGLPDGFDPNGIEFQSKDTGTQQLDRYVLRADGTLWNESAGEQEMAHGVVGFDASNWCGSYRKMVQTEDDKAPWSAGYEALFDHGKLIRIDACPGYALEEDAEHVLRADFERRSNEERERTKRPGEDLHREWIHWSTPTGETLFDHTKWPALAVRFAYLRGCMAWGRFVYPEDCIKDLTDWSTWLSAQEGLSGDEADMLARTKSFLETVSREMKP